MQIAFGRKAAIKDMESPATASVTLVLRPGQQLTPDQISGIRAMVAASDPSMANGRHAAELGISPAEQAFGAVTFGGETNFYAGYREWRRLMERAAAKAI